MNLRRYAATVLLVVSGVGTSAWPQAPTPAPLAPQQFAALGGLKLQSGFVIHDFRLG
jgi:hypothetical protein